MGGRLSRAIAAGTASAALVGWGALVGCAVLVGCAAGDAGGPDDGFHSPDATAPHEAGVGVTPGMDATATADASEDASEDAADGGDASEPGTIDDAGVIGATDAPNYDVTRDAASAGDSDDASPPDDAALDTGSPVDAAISPDEGAPVVDAAPPDAAPLADAAAEASSSCTCSTGYACGASHYCQTSTGVPAFGHVFVVLLDNQPLSAILGSASAPYLNKLMATYAYGTNYTTAVHPSLPNLIDLTSGNPQQLACDCAPGATNTCNAISCNGLLSTCACPVAVSHLGDELDVASVPWREYAESMGGPCNANGADGGALFAANHVPFLYYADVFGNNARCRDRVRDFSDFAADLASGAYRFALISPNLCNDMHGGCAGDAVKQGDTWLAAHVPAILATPGFGPTGSDVLFIVADEPDAFGSAPVPFVVVSPLAKSVTTGGAYTHESLLATIEDGLGVPRMGNTGGLATIADVWR